MLARCSLFSTEIVPTSTGWPFALYSLISFAACGILHLGAINHYPYSPGGSWSCSWGSHHFQLCKSFRIPRLRFPAVPVIPDQLLVHAEIVLERDVASVWFSRWILTPSLASTAWCNPSLQRRPGIMRPVNSSTITTSGPSSPSRINVFAIALIQHVGRACLLHVVVSTRYSGDRKDCRY